MPTSYYSPRKITAYVQWIKRFILFHNKTQPAELGKSHLPLSIAEAGLIVGWPVSAAGDYFPRLMTLEYTKSIKMVLLK